MSHATLAAAVHDLERAGQLIRISHPINPHLEMAEIQRRLYRAGGPAVLFTNPVGCRFPMLANLFGTLDRARFLFRRTIGDVRKLIDLKAHPDQASPQTLAVLESPFFALALPARATPTRAHSQPHYHPSRTSAVEVVAP